jgi:hypothetical protein
MFASSPAPDGPIDEQQLTTAGNFTPAAEMINLSN